MVPLPGQDVMYTSTKTIGRIFKGRVVSVHDCQERGKFAVVRHETQPKLVTVPTVRLTVIDRSSPKIPGRCA